MTEEWSNGDYTSIQASLFQFLLFLLESFYSFDDGI